MRFVFSVFLLTGMTFAGTVFTVSAFDPAQQDDSLALVRHFKAPSNPVVPPLEQGSFVPLSGETISMMGGADIFQMQEYGYFEAMLQTAFPDKQLRLRNLGWASDTVHRQQRPMFFYTEKGDVREGSVPDQREKISPGTMILMFGKMESLDGELGMSEFESAYERLVVRLQAFSKRIVLVAPIPFAEAGPAAEQAAKRNEMLARYTERIASLAERHDLAYVAMDSFPASSFAANGMQLSETGQRQLMTRLGKGLGVAPTDGLHDDVVAAVQKKNHLWQQYYRPTNWAFLFGDRQHVPSSRDHKNEKRRWFEEEMKKLPPLIAEKESEIWSLSKGGKR